MNTLRSCTAALLLALAAAAGPARAADASEASVMSLLPVLYLSEAPQALFSASAALAVVAVQPSGEGLAWTLERLSDGARGTVKLSRGSLGPVGGRLLVVALSTGWVLHNSQGQALAWMPNELGASLLHHERLSD